MFKVGLFRVLTTEYLLSCAPVGQRLYVVAGGRRAGWSIQHEPNRDTNDLTKKISAVRPKATSLGWSPTVLEAVVKRTHLSAGTASFGIYAPYPLIVHRKLVQVPRFAIRAVLVAIIKGDRCCLQEDWYAGRFGQFDSYCRNLPSTF
jgi:hypothetical protein